MKSKQQQQHRVKTVPTARKRIFSQDSTCDLVLIFHVSAIFLECLFAAPALIKPQCLFDESVCSNQIAELFDCDGSADSCTRIE